MLLVSAVLGPLFGPLVDRHGARRFLAAGSILMGCGLAALSQAIGVKTYVLAWVVVGVASPLALSQTAMVALSQIAGQGARKAIGAALLFNALSSSIFWPLAAWLEGHFGWRGTCLAFAGLHFLLCLPLHALLTTANQAASKSDDRGSAPDGGPGRRAQFILAALALSCGGFVAWGLPVHVIEIMRSLGHSGGFAILLGSLMGIAQICARAAEILFGYRFGILSVGVGGMSLMASSFLLPMFGGGFPVAAIGFVISFGLGIGWFTIVRVVAPLELFGRAGYAAVMGSLGVPQSIAFALSPIAFAKVFHDYGPYPALGLGLGVTLIALLAMAALSRSVSRIGRD